MIIYTEAISLSGLYNVKLRYEYIIALVNFDYYQLQGHDMMQNIPSLLWLELITS